MWRTKSVPLSPLQDISTSTVYFALKMYLVHLLHIRNLGPAFSHLCCSLCTCLYISLGALSAYVVVSGAHNLWLDILGEWLFSFLQTPPVPNTRTVVSQMCIIKTAWDPLPWLARFQGEHIRSGQSTATTETFWKFFCRPSSSTINWYGWHKFSDAIIAYLLQAPVNLAGVSYHSPQRAPFLSSYPVFKLTFVPMIGRMFGDEATRPLAEHIFLYLGRPIVAYVSKQFH